MKKVGVVGWRGMVGSVLLQRMQEENDFLGITPYFYSTSNPGMEGPTEAIYAALTVGDQLLWGAAEPLRRMLNILLGRL